MAGVVQEIDLVLAQQAVAKATKDAELHGHRIGTALGSAIGNAPGVKTAARQLGQAIAVELNPNKAVAAATRYVESLERTFLFAQADTREALARNLITPAEARERGVTAARAFNAGVLGQIQTLRNAGALSGRAGQDVFIGLSGKLKSVGEGAEKSGQGINTMRSGLIALAAQATNTSGPIGTLANGLLTFAGGGVVMLAIVAGLALIAKGIELITQKSREAAAETKAFFERLDAAIKERARREDPATAFFGDFKKIAAEIEKLERQLAKARLGSVVETTEGPVTFGPDPKRIARLEAELAKLGARSLEVGQQLREALDASKADALGTAVEKVTDELGTAVQAVVSAGSLNEQVIAQGAEAAAEATRTAGELAAGAITNLTKTWREQNSERLGQIAGQKSAEQQAIEEIEAANVDLHDLLAVHAEEDAARRKAAQIEQLAHLEQQAFRLERIIENTLGIAEAWGLVSKALGNTLAALSRVATDAASLAKSLASGDVLGVIGSGINILGGLGSALGISRSKDAGRLSENERLFRAAQGGDQAALDRLFTLSGRSGRPGEGAGGLEGWATQKAMDDAYRKFLEAQKAMTEGTIEAADSLDLFRQYARQAGLTASETLTGIVAKAAGTSQAFDKIFEGLDLSTKEGMEEAHKRIVQALKDVPLLTAEQLGDLSVQGYLDLLDEAGGLVSQGLDDLGQAIFDAAREAEEAAQEAADFSRRRISSRRDILDLLDRTDPLEIIEGVAGGLPKILQDALGGLDLEREADRDTLDRRIQSLFAQLSTGQLERGGLLEGMSPEDFRGILLEWERLLDEERANEEQRAANEASEAEQRVRDRERAAEEARREAERLEREHQERERDRLQALTEAEQLQVDRRLAAEEQAELVDLEKRARRLGGDPAEAVREMMRLFAEAAQLGTGELGLDSPLARDARRRAEEARREAERLIEQGEQVLGEAVTPGFTVQRTVTESTAGHLISEMQLQTNWLQRIYERLGGIGNPVINVQPVMPGRGVAGGASEVSIDVSRDLAAEFQRAALLNGNAEMR